MAIRKKPKPADPEAPEQPPPAADAEVQPPREYKTVVQQGDPIELPTTPDQVVHNVMIRQLEDDARNPPPDDQTIPALKLLSDLQRHKDAGQSIMPLQEEIGRVTQGVDMETRITLLSYISFQNRNLLGWMQSGDALNKLIWRMCKRGDLKAHEAIVLKRVQVQEQETIVKTIHELMSKADLKVGEDAAKAMDFVIQVNDKSKVNPNLEKMTPQGREIMRKIVVRARRKMFSKDKK